eukprot:SAG11_NODE_1516_length_4766_cov_1.916006_8_plen_213_part_00
MEKRASHMASKSRRQLGALTSHLVVSSSTRGQPEPQPKPAGLSSSVAEQFDHDGFVNAGELLTKIEVAELSAALDALIDTGPDGFGAGCPAPLSFRSFSGSAELASRPNWQIMNCWEACEKFNALVYHPRVVAAVAQLLRTDSVAVWHDQVQYKPAEHGGATGWWARARRLPIAPPRVRGRTCALRFAQAPRCTAVARHPAQHHDHGVDPVR